MSSPNQSLNPRIIIVGMFTFFMGTTGLLLSILVPFLAWAIPSLRPTMPQSRQTSLTRYQLLSPKRSSTPKLLPILEDFTLNPPAQPSSPRRVSFDLSPEMSPRLPSSRRPFVSRRETAPVWASPPMSSTSASPRRYSCDISPARGKPRARAHSALGEPLEVTRSSSRGPLPSPRLPCVKGFTHLRRATTIAVPEPSSPRHSIANEAFSAPADECQFDHDNIRRSFTISGTPTTPTKTSRKLGPFAWPLTQRNSAPSRRTEPYGPPYNCPIPM